MAIRRKKTPEGMAEALVDAQYQLTSALLNDQLNDRIRDAVHRATEAILQEDSQTVGVGAEKSSALLSVVRSVARQRRLRARSWLGLRAPLVSVPHGPVAQAH